MSKANAAHTTTAPGASRVERFLSHIDSHLPTLPSAQARRAFFAGQLKAWQARYAKFIATADKSEPVADPTDPPSAADFLLTITRLSARRDAIAS